MFALLNTLVLTGIDAHPVKVEVDIQSGLPNFEVVGLASVAVKEARERVRAAIKNSGYQFPYNRLTVNLAPADLKKEGSHFDLPMALGILLASEQIRAEGNVLEHFWAGELSLEGTVRRIPGILPMVLELQKNFPSSALVLPRENAGEAALIQEFSTLTVTSLPQAIAYIGGQEPLTPAPSLPQPPVVCLPIPDYAEVKGQQTAKRALQIAAAGLHNVLLIGPPGAGKTMLARRIPGIMPEMTREEILETTRIYSAANMLLPESPLIDTRPFRAPHKSASAASIIGGGRIPRPGEVSLAQNGILFLDELPEFSRDVLEALRQPLEDKTVTVARAQATYTYPASFALIAGMNPCPCGNFGSEVECRCGPQQIRRYLNRISGPLLDRMDMHIEVPRIQFEQLHSNMPEQSSSSMREQVISARERQRERLAADGKSLNSQMGPKEIKKYCVLDDEAAVLLKNAFKAMNLSARAYDRILKVARTVADLEQTDKISRQHIAESLHYRSLDRKYWQ